MSKREDPPMERLMAFLDGEMSDKEARQFQKLLDEHPEWRAQADEMADIVNTANQMKFRIDPSIWDGYWEEIDCRIKRQIGWLLTLAGAAMLILFGFYKVMAYAQNDFVRGGLVFIAVGILVLFFAVLRGRYLEYPNDRYKRIRR